MTPEAARPDLSGADESSVVGRSGGCTDPWARRASPPAEM